MTLHTISYQFKIDYNYYKSHGNQKENTYRYLFIGKKGKNQTISLQRINKSLRKAAKERKRDKRTKSQKAITMVLVSA